MSLTFLSTVDGPDTPVTPFVVEHLRQDLEPNGHFTPAARLLVTPALRTAGLLSALPDREAKTLLCLLAFLTPNGRLQPTVGEITLALGVGEAEGEDRLRRLAALRWEGEPIAHFLLRENGTGYVALSRRVLSANAANKGAKHDSHLPATLPADPWHRSAGRDAVVSFSRKTYGRPRAEVEREIMEQLGHAPEETDDTPEGLARRRLSALGVGRDEADRLFLRHSVEEITDQLDWLPYRNAKNPARFVVAAVERHYAPPAVVRWRQQGEEEPPKDSDSDSEIVSTADEDGSGASLVSPVQEDNPAWEEPGEWAGTPLDVPPLPNPIEKELSEVGTEGEDA